MANREAFYKLIAMLIPRPTTNVNVEVGNKGPTFDLGERLSQAKDLLKRIRNKGYDSHDKTQKTGDVTYTVISPNNKE